MSSIAYLENSLHSWEKEGFGEFLYMLGRVGFLLAASVAAYAIKRPKSKTSRLKPSENGGASTTAEVEAARKEEDEDSRTRKLEKEEEEEEAEEVKTMNSFINATVPSNAELEEEEEEEEEELLPEFESLLSGETEDINPMPENKYDAEAERLRRLVKELEEREAKLEAELLVYYGLEEELKDLQKQLMVKTEEVETLSVAIRSLQEEAAAGAEATKELEVLRGKNQELQRQIQLGLDAGGGGGAPAWITPW